MFNRVVILGVGLLGGSLARDFRHHGIARDIVGVCRSAKTADYALSQNIVDRVLPLQDAVTEADLLVLATPMQLMLPLLDDIAGQISENTILTDVGSVKTDLYEQLRTHQPQLLKQFVLAHPIAGGESSGVGASRTALFEGKHVIVTETSEVSRCYVDVVSQMWQVLGAKVLPMSLERHDAVFARTSHLPHVVAFGLVNYLNKQQNSDELFDLAAAGFYDFTRIASSDAEMWRDVCVTNKNQVLQAIEGFRSELDSIRENIVRSDQQGILDYFAAAKKARDLGLVKKTE